MRALEITNYGGPEVMKVTSDAASPAAPAAGQVIVKVAAAGVNPVDWKIREGYMREFMPLTFPAILGNEIAGTVEAVGPEVTGLAVGDAVYGATGMLGGFAESVALKAELLVLKPETVSFIEAAALPVAAATATVALDTAEVKAGTRILIHAASGGVGSIAVQLAKLRGADVTALASAGNLDFVRELGADHVVDRDSDYERTLGDFDVVLDGHGPEAQARSWGLLRKGGILVSLVAPPSEALAAEHGVRATMVYGTPTQAALSAFNALLAAGKIKVTVSQTYPLETAVAAFVESQTGKVRGKLIVTF